MQKEIKTFIEQPVFLFVEKIKIDIKYFKHRIDEGIAHESNKNYQSNVQSKMTAWNFFCDDEVFIKQVFRPARNIIETRTREGKFKLHNAWGIKQSNDEKTISHDHRPSLASGVVYLDDCDQELRFDQIDQVIKPQKGLLVLFSGILNHYTNRNKSNDKYALSFNLFYV
jgi:hypothetical protein|tara:strand:- start:5238 stop:5744 length:507 start_codon:yes stop_codon:yes gene_type:complete